MINNMKTTNFVLALAAISLLAGCGSLFERKQVDYKAGAVVAPALEVPPDLTVPSTEQRNTIPAADGTQVAKYSDYSREKMNGQVEPGSRATAAASVAEARLLEVGGVRFVMLNEPFDRSWFKVGQALEQARIVVGDMDRSKGTYFLKAGDKDRKTDGLQVVVRETAGISLLTVETGAGSYSAEGGKILETLHQNLDKINRGDAVRPSR